MGTEIAEVGMIDQELAGCSDWWQEREQPDCAPTRAALVEMFRLVERGGQYRREPGQCELCGRQIGGHWRLCARAATLGMDSAQQQARREVVMERQMPELYRRVDALTRAVTLDWVAYDRAMRWVRSPAKLGLTMVGPSGSGKTTALWHVARELAMAGKRVRVLGAGTLTESYHDALRQRMLGDWEHRMQAVEVLAIDDLGKDVATEGLMLSVFRVINGRLEACRPTVITTRFTGVEMAERMTGKDVTIGEDIARRIRDLTEVVKFERRKQDGK